MRGLIQSRIAEIVGYFGSIATLLLFVNPHFTQIDSVSYILSNESVKVVATIVLICCSVLYLLNFFFRDGLVKKIGPGRCHVRRIEKEMEKILGTNLNVKILSRNLSWAKPGSKLSSLLIRKAEGGDLTLYVHSRNESSDILEQKGAEIFLYGDLNFVPESRFTFVGGGSTRAKMAIGYAEGDYHVIGTYLHGGPEFHLANDLLTALEKSCVSKA